ncbi:MAG: zf-HC2 domain-containing protein, partial [Desulfitobacteriaceae bacterium]|nr:zf-HC2 domain-containing protein [Desulfitobacteriaceae bacterium]
MKCEIIKDLLPSYIDGLTSSESNLQIEEHLNNC